MSESSCHQSGGFVHSTSSQSSSSVAPEENLDHPLLLLTQQPDSHNFNERRIVLNDTVKVGRSVARARPCEANAIFDCKVLSRNHAIFWFDNGKVWLKDTKSSNGTFVNSQLLSKGTEDSAPREIYSGDIIQFGVEVVENTTTHGCIIAQTTIFLSDGNELRRHSDMGGAPSGNIPISNYYEEQIYQLAQYIQEASHREQTLEKKLNSLSQLIIDTQEASDSSWKVILNQDRLMEKLELLQEQVDMYAKGDDRDSLTTELHRVLEQRYGLERESKNLLEGLIEEKSDVLQRVVDLEQSLSASEVECSQLRSTLESLQSEHGQISEKLSSGKDEVDHLQKKLQDVQSDYNNEITRLSLEKELIVTRYEQLCAEVEELRVKLIETQNELVKGKNASLEIPDDTNIIHKFNDRLLSVDDNQSKCITDIISEILSLQNLEQKDDSIINSEKNLNIIGTNSNLRLHFIESHREIKYGMYVLTLMKEELMKLNQVIHVGIIDNDDCNIEGILREMETLLEKLNECQSKSKIMLTQIPERLLTAVHIEDNVAMDNGFKNESYMTIPTCHNSVQTDLVQHDDTGIQFYGVTTESLGTQVDLLSVTLAEKTNSLNQNIQTLEEERKLNDFLKMDLLHLQDENKRLLKQSYEMSLTIEEMKSTETFSVKQDMDTRRESVQRIANEGYIQLYQESQDLKKRVLEIEEEMTKKRQEYDILFEQYEHLIGNQTSATNDVLDAERVHELEELCSRQQLELEEMRDSVSSNYQTILTRSRKISALSVIPLCLLLLGIIFSIISVLAKPWLFSS